jgi:hypothetical protein
MCVCHNISVIIHNDSTARAFFPALASLFPMMAQHIIITQEVLFFPSAPLAYITIPCMGCSFQCEPASLAHQNTIACTGGISSIIIILLRLYPLMVISQGAVFSLIGFCFALLTAVPANTNVPIMLRPFFLAALFAN